MVQGICGDAQGRGGALGYLDQQLFKKYTLPIMTTALTSYTSYIMAPKDDDDNSSDTESPRQQAANDALQSNVQRYDSNLQTFLQRLRESPELPEILGKTLIMMRSVAATPGLQEGIAKEISQLLEDAGRERNLSIRIQREDIFNAMHRI